jgi:hypothetical protein
MDNEAVLKLLIELGVINAGQVDNLREKLKDLELAQTEQTEAVKQSSDEMEFVPESLQNISEKAEEQAEHVHHSAAAHRALHQALHKLNEVSPGLGTALAMLTHGFDSAKVSAQGLGPVVEELITKMGPLVILLLGIQAATEYWDLYKEKLKDVAAEQEKAMKKIEESTKKAFDAQQALYDAMHPKADAVKELEEQLKNREQLIQGDLEEQKATLEARKQIELAAAKNPEERRAIEEKYRNAIQQAEDVAKHEELIAKTQAAAKAYSLMEANNKSAQAQKESAGEVFKEIARLENEIVKISQEKFIYGSESWKNAGQKIEEYKIKVDELKKSLPGIEARSGELGAQSLALFEYYSNLKTESGTEAQKQFYAQQAQEITYGAQKQINVESFKPTGEKENLAELLRTLLEHNKLKDSQSTQIVSHLIAHNEDTAREYAFLKARVDALQNNSGK